MLVIVKVPAFSWHSGAATVAIKLRLEHVMLVVVVLN